MARLPLLEIENAKIRNKNFKGQERRDRNTGKIVNNEGNRNFCVIIEDSEQALKMADDGWNIKIKTSDEGGDPIYQLPVAVRFDNYPPRINMITENGPKPMDEDMIDVLDEADILQCDLVISPSQYDVNGRSGIKAYLRTMYVDFVEDSFAHKWR